MTSTGDDPFAYTEFTATPSPPPHSKGVSPLSDSAATLTTATPNSDINSRPAASTTMSAPRSSRIADDSRVVATSRHSLEVELIDVPEKDDRCTNSCAEASETPTSPHPHRHRPKGFLGRLLDAVLPHGGMASSMFNLASATLGASIISLPAAFASSGLVVGILYLVICTVATIYSIHLLMVVHRKTGLASYEEMARALLGYRLDYFTAFLMFVFCYGTTVAYVIALGDLLKPFQEFELPGAFVGQTGNRLLVSLVWLVGMFPLALPKEINALRYASCFGVLAILFFVGVMVWHASTNGLTRSLDGRIDYAVGGNNAVLGLSLVMFAFLCQVNAFEIYGEMHVQTVEKMTQTATFSMGGCLALYIVAGFFGYADFGRIVHGAVLEDYHPRRHTVIAISYVCLIVKLCAAFALCIQPARDALFYVFNWGAYQQVSTVKRVLVCGLMAVSSLVFGLFVPSLEVVFGLLGSLCGGLLGFVFPALFVMYSGEWTLENVGTSHFLATWALLLAGAVAMVFGTAASIFQLF